MMADRGGMATVQRGWQSPILTLLTGAATMLPISALVALALSGAGLSGAMLLLPAVAAVQLLGGLWIAGRLAAK